MTKNIDKLTMNRTLSWILMLVLFAGCAPNMRVTVQLPDVVVPVSMSPVVGLGKLDNVTKIGVFEAEAHYREFSASDGQGSTHAKSSGDNIEKKVLNTTGGSLKRSIRNLEVTVQGSYRTWIFFNYLEETLINVSGEIIAIE